MNSLDKIMKKLDKIKRIKNYNLSYNEEQNKFDIFCKILGDDILTQESLNDILNLQFQSLGNGMYELWFLDDKNVNDILKALGKTLK